MRLSPGERYRYIRSAFAGGRGHLNGAPAGIANPEAVDKVFKGQAAPKGCKSLSEGRLATGIISINNIEPAKSHRRSVLELTQLAQGQARDSVARSRAPVRDQIGHQIGRAPCRERVCQYG